MILGLFDGPGGWDAGLALYLEREDMIGVEWDGAACETRDAAGLKTIQGDVSALDPLDFADDDVEGVIASPPCQLFSTAGSKYGRGALELLADAIRRLFAAGEDPAVVIAEARAEATVVIRAAMVEAAETALDLQRADERAPELAANACLVLEPVRFVIALGPRWVALEQVPAVLPLWEVIAEGLRARGYRVWTGKLNAADYGVPQTRIRAILMASLDGPVAAPERTHAERPEPSLFGPELRPWVTMAEALGWTGRVGFPRLDDRGTSDDGYRDRDWTEAEEPAATVTEKARSWRREPGEEEEPIPAIDGKGRWHLIPGGTGYASPNRRPYSLDEPAPTIAFGRDASSWRWVIDRGTNSKAPGWRADPDTPMVPSPDVSDDRPAPTVTGQAASWRKRRNDQSGSEEVDPDWPLDRPATTVATRDLIPDPGANANRFNGAEKSRNDGYHVEAFEAAVLQSFPPDYPFRGTRTKVFEQIGNAIPPRLAAHVIATLTDTERNRP